MTCVLRALKQSGFTWEGTGYKDGDTNAVYSIVRFLGTKLLMNYSRMNWIKSIKWMLLKMCPTCYCNLGLKFRERRSGYVKETT
ncbi:MAG: hypothetical protein ACTTH0_05405 [Eubacteriales bacterium]